MANTYVNRRFAGYLQLRGKPPTSDVGDKAQAQPTKPCPAMPTMPCLPLAWPDEASERARVWGKVLSSVGPGSLTPLITMQRTRDTEQDMHTDIRDTKLETAWRDYLTLKSCTCSTRATRMGSPAAGWAAGLAATWAAGLAALLVEGLARGLAAWEQAWQGAWQGAPAPVASSLPQEHRA